VRPTRLLAATIEFLRRNHPFSDMESGHLEFLAKRLHTRYCPAGSRIECGDEIGGACLLIVKQGIVEIIRATRRSSRLLRPGDSFVIPPSGLRNSEGDGVEHVAGEDTFCLEVDHDALAELARKSDALRDFLTAAQVRHPEG
jgi:Predicted signal-transduction protein containing cAMP-binding and CBS domains